MKWASQFVYSVAVAANVVFVGLAAVWIGEILYWEGGLQASLILAIVVAIYVGFNSGALLVTSRRGRIIWTILAILANLTFVYWAFCIVGEVAKNFIAAQAFYACVILVVVNSLGIVSKGRLSSGRQGVEELVPVHDAKIVGSQPAGETLPPARYTLRRVQSRATRGRSVVRTARRA